MTKLLTPFVALFLTLLVAKQFKTESELPTLQKSIQQPLQIAYQMPREPVEYGRLYPQPLKPKAISNQPLSARARKSMLSGGNLSYDRIYINDYQTKDYIIGRSMN